MPARAVMDSVEAPSRPRSANSTSAASRIEAFRSAAVIRVVVVTPSKLLLTYYLVKHVGHAIEVGLGQPGVERQRERPLVGRVGAGEGPLVRVRAQPVKGVRADLGFDPIGAQGLERLVAAVEPDDVRLPAVPVALVGERKPHEPCEALGIGGGDPLPCLQELLEPAELRDAHRAEDVRQAVVEAGRRDLEVTVRLDAVVPQAPDRVGNLRVVRGDGAALARGDDLARMEGQAPERPEPAARTPSPARTERSGGVLEQLYL